MRKAVLYVVKFYVFAKISILMSLILVYSSGFRSISLTPWQIDPCLYSYEILIFCYCYCQRSNLYPKPAGMRSDPVTVISTTIFEPKNPTPKNFIFRPYFHLDKKPQMV